MTGPYGAQRISQPGQEMPGTIVFAMVLGVLVTAAWGLCALLVLLIFRVRGVPLLLVVLFAIGMNIVGIVGVARRREWVRWAALAQAIVVIGVVCLWAFRLLWPPLLLILVVPFALHALLQLLPASTRWFRFRPPPPTLPPRW